MKRIISILLCTMLILTAVPVSFAKDSGRVLRIADFETSDEYLAYDDSPALTFSARIYTDNGKKAVAGVYDDEGNLCATMHDDGRSGDKKSGDGIYTAQFYADITSKKTVSYHVEADGLKSSEKSVSYYHMMTDDEINLHEKFWAAAENYRQSLRDEGKTPAQVLARMYDYVKANKYVKADSIQYSNENLFAFEFTWGSVGYVEECVTKYETAGTDFETDEYLTREVQHEASWQDPDFMVFRPYRHSPYQGDFDNEFYTGIANSVCRITGGEMRDFQEQEAYPGNLKDIDKYGFFIIDSHGDEVYGKSYMMMRKGDISQYDYAADISAGHIIASGYDVGVTGSFFTKYVKDEGRTMPGTLLYLVVCFGMSTDTLCDPAIDCGAQLVFGYTDSVSFTWDFKFSETLWKTFIARNIEHPERTNTFSESLEEAVRVNGGVDPYSVESSSTRGWARPRMKGNEDFVLKFEEAKPVTYFRILNNEIGLHTFETAQIEYQVISEGNTKYTIEFESDDESIATVDEQGVVTMVDEIHDAEAGRKTTITATLTDLADAANPKTFTDTCTVINLGIIDVQGIEAEQDEFYLYAGLQGAQINAHVVPENAANKELKYTSSDENVATVSDTGWITPVSEGFAVITVSNYGILDTVLIKCYVKELTFTEALNAKGGELTVDCDAEYPFIPGTDAQGSPCAISSNQKKDSTVSGFTLDAGRMKKGSFISFDWMTSCEEKYDVLRFYVNDMPIDSITGKTEWKTYKYEITETDNYVFRIAYIKDSQMSANDDTAFVRNLELYKYGEKHTVNFYDMDGKTLLASVEVEHGSAAVPPTPPEHEGLVFSGWNKSTERVLTDLDVTAVYLKKDGQVDPTHIVLGDVNADGKVNTADAVSVLKYSADMIQLDEYNLIAANVNRDDKINTADAVLILKFAAGMITEF